MLIFLLMVNTLTSPKRIEQFIWLIVLASGYIGSRAVFDYARGVNLIENGRVQGAVGGMFKNPNDLALNMVAVLPLAAILVLRPIALVKRGRGGAVRVPDVRRRRRVAITLRAPSASRRWRVVLRGHLRQAEARPRVRGWRSPACWRCRCCRRRTGSASRASPTTSSTRPARAKRARSCCEESFDAFVDTPADRRRRRAVQELQPRRAAGGVARKPQRGAAGRLRARRVRLDRLRVPGRSRAFLRADADAAPAAAAARTGSRPARRDAAGRRRSTPAEHDMLTLHTRPRVGGPGRLVRLRAFASVAYNWTFYYLLALAAAPRDYLLARVAAARAERRAAAGARPSPRPECMHERGRQRAARAGRSGSWTGGSAAAPIAGASWSTRARR